MDRIEMNNLALELIEQAKKTSKEKFLTFTEEMYGTDRSTWTHLWDIPVIPTYYSDDIFPFELETIDPDEKLDILDTLVEDEIGEHEAVYIPFEKILPELSEEAQMEYEHKLKNGTFVPTYRAAIVYNEGLWQSEFKGMIEGGLSSSPPKSQDEMNIDFVGLISKVITHERMHSNTHILVSDPSVYDSIQVRNQYGTRIDDLTEPLALDFEDHDEVFIDTMAKIVEMHEKGESIQDTLYRIIKDRNGKSPYESMDDRPVLALLTLFPDELTHWAIMEMGVLHKANVPTSNFRNLLLEKYTEVFHNIDSRNPSKLLTLAGNYFNQTANQTLSPDQLTKRSEMLEMLGVRNINFGPNKIASISTNIDINALFELATSDTAMAQITGATQDIRATQRSLNPKTVNNQSKENIDI